MTTREIAGYTIDVDRAYDQDRHVWVEVLAPGRARIGMDPLGVETMGDLVQLYIQEPGTFLKRGDAFGSVEAAKFVGPLSMPLSGSILARNDRVVADPGLIAKDPMGEGWLLEIEPADPAELDLLLRGEEQVAAWFADKARQYASEGMLAE